MDAWKSFQARTGKLVAQYDGYVAVDSLHLGHEIVTRVAQVHRARFGQAPAPVPFTTCYRLDLLKEPFPAPR